MIKSAPELAAILRESQTLYPAIRAASKLMLPACYVCAGCVTQTVWNARFGYPAEYGIDDIDLIYYDKDDMTEAGEARRAEMAQGQLGDLPFRLDVKNEARVHLWYERKFGYPIAPYPSTEAAIRSFPTTATAVGVRHTPSGLHIYAPFGLEDLLDGIVRPNKAQITEAIYRQKADKWLSKWPDLTVIPW